LSKRNEIVNLNIKQIENSKGNDGKLLENSNKRFTVLYSLSTQMLNPRKTAGDPYTFRDTGNF
jgi:hypothetical protein